MSFNKKGQSALDSTRGHLALEKIIWAWSQHPTVLYLQMELIPLEP